MSVSSLLLFKLFICFFQAEKMWSLYNSCSTHPGAEDARPLAWPNSCTLRQHPWQEVWLPVLYLALMDWCIHPHIHARCLLLNPLIIFWMRGPSVSSLLSTLDESIEEEELMVRVLACWHAWIYIGVMFIIYRHSCVQARRNQRRWRWGLPDAFARTACSTAGRSVVCLMLC